MCQGYSEMADNKVSGAIAKLEADGLTLAGCQKFLKMYAKAGLPADLH